MFRHKLLIILAISCAALVSVRADSVSTHSFPFTFQDGSTATLSLSLQPSTTAFQLTGSGAGRMLWTSADYALELSSQQVGEANLLTFNLKREDGTTFTLQQYSLQVDTQVADQDGIWSYNDFPWSSFVNANLEAPFSLNTSPNDGIPFVVLLDKEGINKVAFGLVRQDHLVQLQGSLNSDSSAYTLSAQALESFTDDQHGDTFYISREGQNWFRVAEAYTKAVDDSRNYSPLTIPDSLFNPTFDSWYFTGDGINQQVVTDLAHSSQHLGFKSYLLDAGWDTTPGQYSLGINGSTGNYMPDPLYFPDFGSLLSQIRDQLGMRVMLWMQQYALGRESVYYPELRQALCATLDPQSGTLEENPALCPRVVETRQHLTDLFERVMNDYNPDALWFDWQDQIPVECYSSHPHDISLFGDGYNQTQGMIQEVIEKHNPDTFVEMRWPFANLNNKPYTQLWQPLDSPGQFENMRLQAMRMRPFSKGVFIGTDEMYWAPELPDSEAARFMATVVFTGIPYFGPNLFKESGQRLDMLRAWLQFYQENKTDLTQGDFEPYGDLTHPDQKIVSSDTTFIYYGNRYSGPVDVGAPGSRVYIVNASPSTGIDLTLSNLYAGLYTAQISDLLLNTDTQFSPKLLDSNTAIHYDVPVGCLLTLTRVLSYQLLRSTE